VSQRPLHVQVAEAIGCKPVPPKPGWETEAELWRCNCHNGPHEDMGAEQPGALKRYDRNWSATGPLIEKYGIGVEVLDDNSWMVWCEMDDISMDIHGDVGNSVLVAICRLILALGKAGKL
jgi:hypothetical protein